MSTRSATIVSLSSSCPSRVIRPSAARARLSFVHDGIIGRTTMMLTYVVRVMAQWRRFNSLLDRLDRMSDRDLAARGLSRSDVIRHAMEHAER